MLSIGLDKQNSAVREKLEYDCQQLIHQGFHIVLEETDCGDYQFLGLHIVDGELSFRNYERIKAVLKNSVAHILTDWVITKEEQRLIHRLVADNYFYFNQAERAAVEASALRALSDCSKRYARVLTRITDYLEHHHEIILEGFINFRLKDYRQQLSETLDTVVDDFMMEFEYKEFIRLLRYFVETQEPRAEEAHVVIKENNDFVLFDSQGKVINNHYLQDTMLPTNTAAFDKLNYEDVLISTLIMLAPRIILVHIATSLSDIEVVDTIKNVFNDRTIICKGCSLCTNSYVDTSNPTEL